MRVIRPTTFAKATHLVDSNAGETVSAWSSGTTYSTLGTQVLYADRVYENVNATGNTNKQPDTNPTYWLDVGPGNVAAMFDLQTSTETTRTSLLAVTLATGRANSIALIGITGTAVRIVSTDGPLGDTMFDETVDLLVLDEVSDWYGYFFDEIQLLTDVVRTNLPIAASAYVSVQITGSGNVGVGELIFGNAFEIGGTLTSPKVGIIDYSVKETDEFGEATFVQRGFARKLSAQVLLENRRLNMVMQALSGLRATPTVWIGHDRQKYARSLIVFGFAKDWGIDVAYPDYSLCALEIEGLT